MLVARRAATMKLAIFLSVVLILVPIVIDDGEASRAGGPPRRVKRNRTFAKRHEYKKRAKENNMENDLDTEYLWSLLKVMDSLPLLESSIESPSDDKVDKYQYQHHNYMQKYPNSYPYKDPKLALIRFILTKLLLNLPLAAGYLKVLSYLNVQCSLAGTCPTATITRVSTFSFTDTTTFTETSVSSSTSTSTATLVISTTLTVTTTPVVTQTFTNTLTESITNTLTFTQTQTITSTLTSIVTSVSTSIIILTQTTTLTETITETSMQGGRMLDFSKYDGSYTVLPDIPSTALPLHTKIPILERDEIDHDPIANGLNEDWQHIDDSRDDLTFNPTYSISGFHPRHESLVSSFSIISIESSIQ